MRLTVIIILLIAETPPVYLHSKAGEAEDEACDGKYAFEKEKQGREDLNNLSRVA